MHSSFIEVNHDKKTEEKMRKLKGCEKRKFLPSLGNSLTYSVSWFFVASISRRRATLSSLSAVVLTCSFNSLSSASTDAIFAGTSMLLEHLGTA